MEHMLVTGGIKKEWTEVPFFSALLLLKNLHKFQVLVKTNKHTTTVDSKWENLGHSDANKNHGTWKCAWQIHSSEEGSLH